MARELPKRAWMHRLLLARLTLLLGLFCMCSHVSGALHWALVEHVRCAEHGDWVHAGQQHEASSERRAPEPVVGLVDSASDEHDHDHCQFLFDRRELTLPPLATVTLSAACAHDGVAVSALPRAAAGVLIYVIAPKTSPPV